MRGVSGMAVSFSRRTSLRGGSLRRRVLPEVAGLDDREPSRIEVAPQGGGDLLGGQRRDPLLDLLVPIERTLQEQIGREGPREAAVLRADHLPGLEKSVLRLPDLLGGEAVLQRSVDLLAER